MRACFCRFPPPLPFFDPIFGQVILFSKDFFALHFVRIYWKQFSFVLMVCGQRNFVWCWHFSDQHCRHKRFGLVLLLWIFFLVSVSILLSMRCLFPRIILFSVRSFVRSIIWIWVRMLCQLYYRPAANRMHTRIICVFQRNSYEIRVDLWVGSSKKTDAKERRRELLTYVMIRMVNGRILMPSHMGLSRLTNEEEEKRCEQREIERDSERTRTWADIDGMASFSMMCDCVSDTFAWLNIFSNCNLCA